MFRRSTPRVAVLSGGTSREAEVSRSSAREVIAALSESFEHVESCELDASLPARLAGGAFDVVFPVLHGPPGEDGTVQGFLEILGLPYVGSGVRASSVAMDKVLAKAVFRQKGLPVARDVIVDRATSLDAALESISRTLGSSVVVKPSGQGSAVGVTLVDTRPQLIEALAAARSMGDTVLVEERVVGREVTCGVLEGLGPALPVCEIRTPAGSWYDFEHRYTPGLSEHLIPAPLGEARNRRVQEIAVGAHEALGCRDLSRVDFVVPDVGEPVLLEVNTLPGMTGTSLFPDEARAAGISFEELVRHLVLRAWERHGRLQAD